MYTNVNASSPLKMYVLAIWRQAGEPSWDSASLQRPHLTHSPLAPPVQGLILSTC